MIPITRLLDRRVLVLFESLAYARAFSNVFEFAPLSGRACSESICIDVTYGFRKTDIDAWGFDAVVIATDLDIWGDYVAYRIFESLPPGVEAFRGYPIAFTPRLMMVERIRGEVEERLEERYLLARALMSVRRELGLSRARLSTLLALYRLSTEDLPIEAVVKPTTCWLAIEVGNPPRLLHLLERLYLQGRCTYPRTSSSCLPPHIARACGCKPIHSECVNGKVALAPLTKSPSNSMELAMHRLVREAGTWRELLDDEQRALALLDNDYEDIVGYSGRLEGARIWSEKKIRFRGWETLGELLDPSDPDIDTLIDRLETIAKVFSNAFHTEQRRVARERRCDSLNTYQF